MQAVDFQAVVADTLEGPTAPPPVEWVWEGYLARGTITLLTSRWKAGKTTLLAGLLRALGGGGMFLDRPCRAAKAVVVSEESRQMWAARLKAVPVGPHARLILRPFPGRPTPDEWNGLVDQAERMLAADGLDLLVVDPLASFLPGRSDSDPGTLLALLDPLRRLAERGVAVLILHHPRKAKAEEGSSARGSGALLGYVDVILELHLCGSMRADERRRRLVGLSRHPDTPPAVVYEWTPRTPEFRTLPDPVAAQFQDNWEQVKAILAGRRSPATHRELLDDWPAGQPRPAKTQLYEWLSRATGEGLVKRVGGGTKTDPYRFRLPRGSDLDLPPDLDILDLDHPVERLPPKYRG